MEILLQFIHIQRVVKKPLNPQPLKMDNIVNTTPTVTLDNSQDDINKGLKQFDIPLEYFNRFCKKFKFSPEEIDNKLGLIFWLCNLHKIVTTQDLKQSDCFIAFSADLLCVLGFKNPLRLMEIIFKWQDRDVNLYKKAIIPVQDLHNDTDNKINGVEPFTEEEDGFNGFVISPPMFSENPEFEEVNGMVTLVRCGYLDTVLISLEQNALEVEDIIYPICSVLDFDMRRPDIYIKEDKSEEPRYIQMFDCQSRCSAQLVLWYMKLLPQVVDGVVHNEDVVSLLIRSNHALTLEELIGTDMHHKRDISKVSDGYYDGVTMFPIHDSHMYKGMNYWPITYKGHGLNTNTEFPNNKADQQQLMKFFEIRFNTKIKCKIALWLCYVWDKIKSYTAEDLSRSVYVVLTHDNIQDMNKIMGKDHCNAPNLSIINPSHEEFEAMIECRAPLNELFMMKSLPSVTDDRNTEIVNPLSYAAHGTHACVITVDSFFKIMRKCFQLSKRHQWRRNFKTGGLQDFVEDTTPFYDVVHALTDVQKVGISFVEIFNFIDRVKKDKGTQASSSDENTTHHETDDMKLMGKTPSNDI